MSAARTLGQSRFQRARDLNQMDRECPKLNRTSVEGRLLVISHTDRGENIRIISAREATRGERRDYEDGNFP